LSTNRRKSQQRGLKEGSRGLEDQINICSVRDLAVHYLNDIEEQGYTLEMRGGVQGSVALPHHPGLRRTIISIWVVPDPGGDM